MSLYRHCPRRHLRENEFYRRSKCPAKSSEQRKAPTPEDSAIKFYRVVRILKCRIRVEGGFFALKKYRTLVVARTKSFEKDNLLCEFHEGPSGSDVAIQGNLTDLG